MRTRLLVKSGCLSTSGVLLLMKVAHCISQLEFLTKSPVDDYQGAFSWSISPPACHPLCLENKKTSLVIFSSQRTGWVLLVWRYRQADGNYRWENWEPQCRPGYTLNSPRTYLPARRVLIRSEVSSGQLRSAQVSSEFPRTCENDRDITRPSRSHSNIDNLRKEKNWGSGKNCS